MNQDLLYKCIFFGGSYAITFFLVYLAGRRASRTLAIRLSLGSWIVLMTIMVLFGGTISGLVFIPTVIALLVVFRKKVDKSLDKFFPDNHIYKAISPPDEVAKVLGSAFYSCAETKIKTVKGDEVPIHWWQGMTSSTVSTGNTRTTTFNHFLAISFAPNVVSDEFRQVVYAKADLSKLTFKQKFRRFFRLDTERPCRIEETLDGSFIVMWQTYQTAECYTYYLNFLKENLSMKPKAKPVQSDKLETATKTTAQSPGYTDRKIQDKPMLEHAARTQPQRHY
ncbi:hypothetical protein GCM10028805_31130 [Spirosoma harenae]